MSRKPSFSEAFQGVFKGQKTELPHPFVNLSNATVIVTGSNGGLGKEVASKLAAMAPAKLILAVRSVSKGEAARDDIVKLNPGLGASVIDVWQLDMADLASVKAFAARATAELERLDVAVLNAGIEPPARVLTKDGWESTLQVNAIATFYLSMLLYPLLQRTARSHYPTSRPNTLAKPHLSIVSSGLHYNATLNLRDSPEILAAMNDGPFETRERYMDTKLLEVLWSAEFARRAEKIFPGAVSINASNPGFCYSGLQDSANEGRPLRALFYNTMKWFSARTSEMGARALTWAAVSAESTYSGNCEEFPPLKWTTTDDGHEVAGRLWSETMSILTKYDPSLASISPVH